jgi:ribosomal protein S18 acetylase RimI-like enzyme
MYISTELASDCEIDALADLLQILFEQELEFQSNKELQISALQRIITNPNIGGVICAKLNTLAPLSESKPHPGFDKANLIIGMVSILFTESTALGGRVALLEDMIVLPQYQKQGVGSKLLEAAIDFAKRSDCKRITLLTDSDNKVAQSFYEDHGFKSSQMVPYRYLI